MAERGGLENRLSIAAPSSSRPVWWQSLPISDAVLSSPVPLFRCGPYPIGKLRCQLGCQRIGSHGFLPKR